MYFFCNCEMCLPEYENCLFNCLLSSWRLIYKSVMSKKFFLEYRQCLRFYSCKSKSTLRESMTALRPLKSRSNNKYTQNYFSDSKSVKVCGGNGGNGCVSFLKLWCNERAGPDGGDGGNGGHVIFKASKDVINLNNLSLTIRGEDGQCGGPQKCHGRNARHTVVKVPIGTIVRTNNGVLVGDLYRENIMFVAARGGTGGKGNIFFTTDKQNSPKICELGPNGEDKEYRLEMRGMADIGIIGFPNAGKSTLLNAITRARSKVAPYAFTTIQPHIGIITYGDHIQLAVADLPGIILGSHGNKGLGLKFLNHVERCTALIYLLDASFEYPWCQYEKLCNEVIKFNQKLATYPKIIVANKIDKAEAARNVSELKKRINVPVVGVSAKEGTNLMDLLKLIRLTHENSYQNIRK